jgi:hypothetical protein
LACEKEAEMATHRTQFAAQWACIARSAAGMKGLRALGPCYTCLDRNRCWYNDLGWSNHGPRDRLSGGLDDCGDGLDLTSARSGSVELLLRSKQKKGPSGKM